jgi:hypothetical protein
LRRAIALRPPPEGRLGNNCELLEKSFAAYCERKKT